MATEDIEGPKNLMTTSYIDRFCILLIFAIGLISTVAYLMFFKKDVHNLSLVCNQMTHLKGKICSTSTSSTNYMESSRNECCFLGDRSQRIVIFGLIFNILASTLFGILVLYLIKSALGIDIFKGFSFGVWDWFKGLWK